MKICPINPQNPESPISMPRNISYSLTTRQVREQSKDVTRRQGWLHLKKGDILNACVKCMGLKKGEKPERICQVQVVSVKRESLQAMLDDRQYGYKETMREGFPDMSPEQFVAFFCKSHKGCTAATVVTRIEFKYFPFY